MIREGGGGEGTVYFYYYNEAGEVLHVVSSDSGGSPIIGPIVDMPVIAYHIGTGTGRIRVVMEVISGTVIYGTVVLNNEAYPTSHIAQLIPQGTEFN